MEAFMVDLRDVRIQRDEFEIAQRDRLFRLVQPPRVWTVALFEQVRDRSNFSLDVKLAREIVSGDEPGEMQEKLSAQSQRIDGSLTCVRKDVVLMGPHKRYEVVDGRWSLYLGRFLIWMLGNNLNCRFP